MLHYGKKGMAVGIIITIAVVFFVGAGFVTGVGFCDTVIAWVESLSGSIVAGVLVIGAVAAAVFYVISLVMMLRVVSKYEVRV